MFYLHVQDLVDAYIGPFKTIAEAEEHFKWTQEQGDGAINKGISPNVPPAGEWAITPEDDKAFDRGTLT